MKKQFLILAALLTISSSAFAGRGGGNTLDVWNCDSRTNVHTIQLGRLWTVREGELNVVHQLEMMTREKDRSREGFILDSKGARVGKIVEVWFETLTVEFDGRPRLHCTYNHDLSY